jgi:hypothetical protein
MLNVEIKTGEVRFCLENDSEVWLSYHYRQCEDSCLLVRNAVQFGTKVSDERVASIRIIP